MYMSLHQYINNNSNKYAKGTHVCIHIYIYTYVCRIFVLYVHAAHLLTLRMQV